MQAIEASDISVGVKTFGFSLAGNVDVDNNGYPGQSDRVNLPIWAFYWCPLVNKKTPGFLVHRGGGTFIWWNREKDGKKIVTQQ